jgi:hypothetical protein
MEPATTLLAPRVAAVPRAQRTFSALAPFCRIKNVSAAVTRVVPAWKRNKGLGWFRPSSVTTVPEAKLIALSER